MSNNPLTQIDKTDAFLRYVASVASRVTLGEIDPNAVNWAYMRDQATKALMRHGVSNKSEVKEQLLHM